ncbi:MAG: hypothetical protein KDJ37_10235 [Hyphomicrobiaceae bacterium]|nr:hypothetical protein [Hyphomicrobiaceae bacterium]
MEKATAFGDKVGFDIRAGFLGRLFGVLRRRGAASTPACATPGNRAPRLDAAGSCGATDDRPAHAVAAPDPAPCLEVFEGVVRRAPWVLHVPLFSVDGGPLRRLDGGEVETGDIVGLAPMVGLRAERNRPWARHYAGLPAAG